jgi:hypothetical protein
MNHQANCFVDMPFGKKTDLTSGVVIDFDAIFIQAIEPAIEKVGLKAERGDMEKSGGIIQAIGQAAQTARSTTLFPLCHRCKCPGPWLRR